MIWNEYYVVGKEEVLWNPLGRFLNPASVGLQISFIFFTFQDKGVVEDNWQEKKVAFMLSHEIWTGIGEKEQSVERSRT